MTKATLGFRALLLTSALAPAIAAQAAAPADQQQDANAIIVTGSAIPTSPDAIAVPVSIVNADVIAKGGVNTNVLEILRKQIPAFAGRSNTGNSNAANTNQNTAGGSSIQLRNLDTLVLVNGRRVAVSAIAAVNGKVFVNVAEIPPSAIERIEVLTDGASAIYGSDAIGGVVNIILKSNYEGGRISTRAGVSFDGAYNEKSVDATYGFNPFKGTNVTLSASYSRSSPLYQNQRRFASPFYSTSKAVPGAVGDYYLAPGLTAPTPGFAAKPATDPQYINAGPTTATAPGTGIGGTYDLSRFNTLLLEQEQKSAAVSIDSDLSGNRSIEFFADFEYAKNTNFTRFAPVTATVKPAAGTAFNPFTTAQSVVLGSTANPKTYRTGEESLRGTAGFKGQLASIGRGWNWEAAFTHSQNTLDQVIDNVIFAPNRDLAVAGGFDAAGVPTTNGAYSMVHAGFSPTGALILVPALNPFATAAGQSAASLANVLTRELIHSKSKLDSADAKLAGTIGKLPGGRPSFAIGGQWRRESLSGAPDVNGYVHVDGTLATPSQALYTGGLSADPFNARRTITAEYAELRIPLTGADFHLPGIYNFDLIGAVRHEHYSDAGNSTVPKIGFRWQPVARQITVRGSYARSFTAPSLYALGGPLNIRQGGAAIVTNAFPSAIAGTIQVEDGNNPRLQPAKSQSFSLGLVLKPDFIPRLHADVEFSSVKEVGQPAGIGFNNILLGVNALGSASPFAGNIATGALPGSSGAVPFVNPGDVLAYVTNPANSTGGNYPNLYLIDRFTNLGVIKIKAINVNVDYAVPTADAGIFSFATQAAILLSYKFQAIPGQPIYEFAGTTTQGGGAQGTLPRFRAYTTAEWEKGHVNVGIAHTFIGAVQDIGTGGYSYDLNSHKPGQTTFFPGHVKAYSAFDLRFTYHSNTEGAKTPGLTLTAGVNDVFDAQPPISTNINPAAGAAAGATAWRAENNTDIGTYGAIGRLLYVSAAVRF